MMSSTSTAPMARCAGVVIHSRRGHCKVRAVAASAAARGSICSCSDGSKRMDYYKVLSLEHPAAAGAEEIKRAYRRLALRYHPDACPPSRRAESTELFLELRRAYETLSDPAQRVVYDAEMRATGLDAGETCGAAFPRDVWEAQLCGLRARSEQRQRARSGGVV
ncbi:unnamed protein product [Urochloa decumbens]|uniref:J domain-containing protein n=1 Tax=Urochloa decumbens TaxID=240449 RepID=A0ABC9FFQ6_9POAL